MELAPIVSEDGIGFYLGGYLSKSLAHKPPEAKGTRSVTYSQGYARKVKGAWSWANPSAWLWRAKLRTWAAGHGCQSMRDVAAMFGPRWAYHHRETILAVKLDYYPTAEHAKRDGCWMPNDATDIRITRHSPPLPSEDREEVADQSDDLGNKLEPVEGGGAFGFHDSQARVSSRVLRDSGQTKCGVVPPEPPRVGPSEIQSCTPVGDKPVARVRSYTLLNKTLVPRLHLQKRLQL
jgi:hypothetical protein